jgi:hypothetical protein
MNGIFANYLWTTVLGKRNLNILNHVIFPAKIQNFRMINMSSECEYDWYWKISACSTEYEVCDSFASLTRQQTSYTGSAVWYFRYQSIHIQITYTYRSLWKIMHAMQLYNILFISNIFQVCINYQIRMQCSSFTWIFQTFLYSAQFTTQATSHKYI